MKDKIIYLSLHEIEKEMQRWLCVETKFKGSITQLNFQVKNLHQ